MNILLTSAGRRSYLVNYFKDALTDDGEVHAANSEWSTALNFADKSVITPLIYDNEYIDFLINYSIKNKIRAIIPLFDIDLPVLARNKAKFKNIGVEVVVSDHYVTKTCNDKWLTYKFLQKNNINSPKTFISLDEALQAVNQNVILFPLIIKPRWGMGSMNISEADNISELKVLYKKVKRDILKSYLIYESKNQVNKAILIQEKIVGLEYGLDVVNDLQSNYIVTFVKKKLAMRSGETDQAITENNKTLQDLGEKIAKLLNHIGNLDVDCFLVDDKPYILEMNARFGGGYPFSHIAGADLPKAILSWLQKKDPDPNCFSITNGCFAAKNIDLITFSSYE